MSEVNNSAVLKTIASKIRKYNELLIQHDALMVVHTKTVNDFADLSLKHGEVKKTVIDLTKIIVQWEKENEILQESLDGCQLECDRLHGEIHHLIHKEELMGR